MLGLLKYYEQQKNANFGFQSKNFKMFSCTCPASRTSTSSTGCRPFRRSIALRWFQFSTELITYGA